MVSWTDDEKAAFVTMQFEAQDASYHMTYPDGRFLVVLGDGVPIGRLYLGRLADEIRIVDITLLPDQRGAGIGSRLIDDVLAEADAAGLAVRLHVEPWNPALRLYERRGFRVVEERGAYLFMERPPLS
jgi:ribosomal protein S18 acetylase RimI-like enzyme